ncbi:MAG: hypothetical protein H5T92_00320 [Synergistales bacterium]|nr:hypothetical protein [Synergistales bacterium]
MPKEGYYALTIRKSTAERFQALAKSKGVGLVDFFDQIASKLEELEKMEVVDTKTLVQTLVEAYDLLKTVDDLDRFLESPYTTIEKLFGTNDKERIDYELIPLEDAVKINAIAGFARSEAGKIEAVLNRLDPDWRAWSKQAFFIRPMTRRGKLELKLDFAYRLEALFGEDANNFLEVIKKLEKIKEPPPLQSTINALLKCHEVFKGIIKKCKPQSAQDS